MVMKHFCSSNTQAAARDRGATVRDFVMGIGAEGYAELDNLIRRPPGVSIPTPDLSGSTSMASTGTRSKSESNPERLETQMAPSPHEEDDSEPEVVVLSCNIIPKLHKRQLSVTSTPGPRSKRARTVRALSDEPQLSESESEEDSGEEESGYDDDNEAGVDPEHKQKSALAIKEFASACRSCKSNANKALKSKYDLEISKLKSDHKQELRDIKADKAEILADTKTKAATKKAKAKTKYEKQINELKSHRDEKIAELVDKHKEAAEEWQDKADDFKKKIKKLTAQRDEAEAKRKEIERSAADDIKAAKDDLKAGERKLREEKKQMMREKQDEIDLLKPQHSAIVKGQDKAIKEFTQKVLKLEHDVQSRDHALQRVQTNHETILQRFQQLKIEHTDAQKHTKQLEKDLNEAKKYAEGVNGRADVRLVRMQEKLEFQEHNTKEHANRVINLQRENYQLKDNLATTARLGREKRDEVNRLKAELQSTKAELGVVKDMEEMSGGFE